MAVVHKNKSALKKDTLPTLPLRHLKLNNILSCAAEGNAFTCLVTRICQSAPTLEELDVSSNHLSSDDGFSLFNALSFCTRLQVLDITSCRMNALDCRILRMFASNFHHAWPTFHTLRAQIELPHSNALSTKVAQDFVKEMKKRQTRTITFGVVYTKGKEAAARQQLAQGWLQKHPQFLRLIYATPH